MKRNYHVRFSIPALAAVFILQSSPLAFAEQTSKTTYNEPVIELSPEKPVLGDLSAGYGSVMWTVGTLLAVGVGVAVLAASKNSGGQSTPAPTNNGGGGGTTGGGSNAGSATVAW